MPKVRLVLLALVAWSAASALHAAKGYHLWYDESGQAVYSQFGPGEGRDSVTVEPPPSRSESAEAARQRLRERLQQFEDQREDAALDKRKAKEAETEAASARARCAAARNNLQTLTGHARKLYRTADGRVIRLSEEQRAQKRAEMEKIVAAECRSS